MSAAEESNRLLGAPTAQAKPGLTSIFRRTASGQPDASQRSTSHLSLHDVHPSDAQAELPAHALPAAQETRLHDPKWAQHAGPPNHWARFRHVWREELAEFWGTFLILLFGAGVECQVNLNADRSGSRAPGAAYGDYLQGRLAWAAGVAMAVWMSGGVSGGHCNPTVTVALSLFRGFPARKVPGFVVAQVLGSTLASLLVYLNYSSAISLYEGGPQRTVVGDRATAGLFFTLPADFLSYGGAFYCEFLASAALLGMVFALADKGNLAPPKGTQPFAMFIVLLGIGAALGVNTGYAMNGARDTGPRIALSMVGYGSQVWTHDYAYFLWAPWIAAITGGVAGAACYDAFMSVLPRPDSQEDMLTLGRYTGRDSPFNRPRGGRRNPRLVDVDDEEGA